MTNNSVSVGHSNTGNVCGGNLTINHSSPFFFFFLMLTYEDYQRFPYCNQCISSFRNQTFFRYQKHAIAICWVISTLVISGFYFIMGRLPNFAGIMFQKHNLMEPLIPLMSTLILCLVIFCPVRVYARFLAKKYINQNLSYH